jgi:fructokinase
MQMKKPIIAGIGELLWDCLPSGKQLGGAPCNFAYHAMQAGCESYVISAIGKDELGVEIKSVLQQLELSCQYIQENKYPTSTVTVRLNDTGQPDYTIHEHVAWDYISWNTEMERLASALDAVCFGSLAQRNDTSQSSVFSFIQALKPSCLKVFDINLRQHYYTKETILSSIQMADVLKLNDEELPIVAQYLGLSGNMEAQVKALIANFELKYLIYTMGGKGSLIYSVTETSFTEVPKIEVADTVGAGDSFTAIFIAGILQGIPLKEVHQKATEVAAYVCTQRGATPKHKVKTF